MGRVERGRVERGRVEMGCVERGRVEKEAPASRQAWRAAPLLRFHRT